MPLHTFGVPPQPFTVSFSPEEISDLNHRLDRARWPKEDVVPDDGPAEAPGSFWMGHGELRDRLLCRSGALEKKATGYVAAGLLTTVASAPTRLEGLAAAAAAPRQLRGING